MDALHSRALNMSINCYTRKNPNLILLTVFSSCWKGEVYNSPSVDLNLFVCLFHFGFFLWGILSWGSIFTFLQWISPIFPHFLIWFLIGFFFHFIFQIFLLYITYNSCLRNHLLLWWYYSANAILTVTCHVAIVDFFLSWIWFIIRISLELILQSVTAAQYTFDMDLLQSKFWCRWIGWSCWCTLKESPICRSFDHSVLGRCEDDMRFSSFSHESNKRNNITMEFSDN